MHIDIDIDWSGTINVVGEINSWVSMHDKKKGQSYKCNMTINAIMVLGNSHSWENEAHLMQKTKYICCLKKEVMKT